MSGVSKEYVPLEEIIQKSGSNFYLSPKAEQSIKMIPIYQHPKKADTEKNHSTHQEFHV